jgi:hypothetical protein
MAFPATYNFSYYRGDTLEFRIYPKDTSGLPFSLEDYTVTFTISTARGSAGLSNQVEAYSTIVDSSSILCAIRPEDSLALPNSASSTYVYDVEIRKPGASPYPLTYTILNGNITVQEQVTDIQVSLPNGPTNLVITQDAGVVTIDWDAPVEGDEPVTYVIYGKSPAIGATTYLPVATITHPTTSYEVSALVTPLGSSPFQDGVQYDVKVTAANAAGENEEDFIEDSFTYEGA